MKTLGLSLGLILLSIVATPGANLTWNNPAGGNWNDPLNWTPNQVPGSGDTATIAVDGIYTVQITDNQSILNATIGGGAGSQTLEIAGSGTLTFTGAIDGPGLVRVAGALNWNSGTMSGPGTTKIVSGGSLNLNSAATKSLANARTIDNAGTLAWNGTGPLIGTSASTINNQGVFVLSTDSTFSWGFSGGFPIVNNLAAGIIRKTASAGTFSFQNTTLNQSGTVDVQSGTLDLIGGTVNATTGCTFTGTGTGLTRLVSSTFTAAAGETPAIAGHFEFVTGTFNGPGTITITGEMIWSGGSMSGAGTTRVESGATLIIAGTAAKGFDSGRTLENHGLIRFTGSGTLSGVSAPQISNHGELRLEADASIAWAFSGGRPLVDNFPGAVIRKTAGSGLFDFSNTTVNNAGSVETVVGTLRLSGGGSASGPFTTAAGTATEFSAGTFDWDSGTTLSGPGTFRLNGGTVTVSLGTIASIAADAHLEFSGGALQGTGEVEVSGNLLWTGGSMFDLGTTRIAAGGALELAGSGAKGFANGRVLRNDGLVRWTGTGPLSGQSAPLFANHGELRLEADSSIAWAFSGGVPIFENSTSGIVVKSAGAGAFAFNNVNLALRGLVRAESGQIRFNSSSTCSGPFSALAGASVEFAAGTHTFDGNSTWDGAGTYRVQSTLSVADSITVAANALVELTGTIQGLGTFLINERVDWSNGNMAEAGTTRVAATGTLELTGGVPKGISNGRILDNLGTLRFIGSGALSAVSSPIIHNRNLLRIEAVANATLSWGFSGGIPTIQNHVGATIVKVGAASVFTFANCTLNNDGTVQVDAGTINLNAGGVSTGAFIASAGATLEHAAGIQTDTGGEIRALPGGTVHISGGTFVLTGGGTLAAPGTLQVSAGVLELSGSVDASVTGTFAMSSGALRGTADLVLLGTGTWSGGDMSDPGTTRVAAGGVLELAGSAAKSFGLGRVLDNQGLVRWTGSGPLSGYSAPIFNNRGELRIETDSTLNWAFFGGVPLFNNLPSGSVIKTAGAGEFGLVNTTVTKRGPMRAEVGQISLYSGSTASGQWTALAGASIRLAGGTHTFDAESTWDGAGTYALQTGINVNEGVTLDAQARVELTGSIAGLGTFLISERTVWSTGSMSDPGTTRIGASGLLELSSSSSKSFGSGRILDNQGTILWTGSGTLSGTSGSELNNRGLLHLQTDASLTWGFFGAAPRFNNLPSGTIRLGVSGPAAAQISELALQNTVAHLDGTLQIDLLGGYSPSINDSLSVIALPGNGTPDYGTFATLLPLVFGTGLKFEPHYDLTQVRLVAAEAPQTTITEHPVSATVECGQSHAFSVTATGSGTLTYQWRRNGVAINGATGPTLTLSPARSSDAGVYDVIATDSSTAATSQPATLTVNDSQPPTITCPVDIVTSSTDLAGTTVSFSPTANDACDPTPTVTCSPASGSTFPVGTTSVTCTARDAANLTANCTFAVTVHFCQEFSATVNQPVPDNHAAGLSSTITVASPILDLVDVNVVLHIAGGKNGDLQARLTHNSGTAFLLNRAGKALASPDGYADAGLNVLLDDQAAAGDIHVYQLQPFTSPLTGAWQPDGRATDPTAVLDTDARNALLDQFNGLNPSGTWTLLVTDHSPNNTATLVSWGLQICGTKDTTAPTITACAPATTIDAKGTCQAQVPDLTSQVVATDNSGVAPTVTQTPAPGTTIGLGLVTISFNVRDPAGNTALCAATLTVQDTTPPTLTACPPSQNLHATSGCDASTPDLTPLAGAFDCSGPVTLTQNPAPGTALGPGPHTVTIRARDTSGNESTCSVAVTVAETTAPIITACAPAISLDANANCQASLPDLRSQIAASDCNLPLTIIQAPASGTSVGLGAHLVSFVVRDAGGNEATCSTTVTVVDGLKPVITACAVSRSITADATCVALVPDLRGEVSATDCSGPVTVSQSPPPGTPLGLGPHAVVLTARDAAGNSETCTLTLTVRDETAPTILTCVPNQTLAGNASCSATLPDLRPELAATDCSGTVTINQNPAPGSPLTLGSHPVTFTVQDASGNTATCHATVSVEETVAPIITQCAPHQTVIAGPNCTAPAPDLTALVQATDCDLPLSFSQSPPPGATLVLGANVITLTVRDAAGNATTCAATVTVKDETVPTITACSPNASATADANCQAPAPDLRSAVSASDCNGPLSYQQVPPPNELLPVGTHPITIIVADAANNVISCTAQFTVTDRTAPAITACPASRTLATDANCTSILPDLRPEVAATDCQGPLTITQDPSPGTSLALGIHPVTLTVHDPAGNESTCSVTITVQDQTPPTFGPTPNLTVPATSGAGAVVTYTVTATDQCSGSPIVACQPASGTLFSVGTTPVLCTARDTAGNQSSRSFSVTVTPLANQPPVARPDLLLVFYSQPVTFPVSALLSNDSDPDGQTVQFVGVDSTSSRGGTITLAGNQITYRQPATGIPLPVGIDSFRYRITDGTAAPVQGLVNVLISRVPRTGISPASTSSENVVYEVQRTVDFVQWTTLTAVMTNGSPAAILDSNPPEEKAFYRLVPRARNTSNP